MLILASTSVTRRALLENAGLEFETAKPDVDEAALVRANPDWTPEETAMRLAEAKAVDVSRRRPGALVVGADQVLGCNNRIYSKPGDMAAARRQLSELRSTQHHLISAVVCAARGKAVWRIADRATLTMRNFSDAFLASYLESNGDKTLKSVGGYQIEGLGIQLFEKIDGDFHTVLGLPLLPLLGYLRLAGEISA